MLTTINNIKISIQFYISIFYDVVSKDKLDNIQKISEVNVEFN